MQRTHEMQLEELLSIDPASIVGRNRAKFDEIAGKCADSIVLAGAGELGRKALAGLRRLRVEPLAFADNNPSLWGKVIDGVGVVSPQEAARRFGTRAVFVATVYNGSRVRRQLSELQCSMVTPVAYLFWKYPETFLPHGGLDLPLEIHNGADEVRRGLSLWADEASREEFLAQLKWRYSLDFDALPGPLPIQDIYFPSDLVSPLPEEVYVDCGAFDGDSIKNFIQARDSVFRLIVAIEADPKNYLNLQETIKALPGNMQDKIITRQLAVGKEAGRLRFEAMGTAGSRAMPSGGVEVECARLDDIVRYNKPTYIKMDIEGAELEALSGAKRIIKDASAVWAICSYHKQNHLWKIPQFIQSQSGAYEFYLRRYAEECWELICYAIPKSRLIKR